jgi:Uma2 family endonuclease
VGGIGGIKLEGVPMVANAQKKWTVEEYLDFERKSEERHEYFDGEIFAMSGASEQHILITGNTFSSLLVQLRKRPCKVYPIDMRVKVSPIKYTYPDISVVCGEPQFEGPIVDMLLNPTVIVEVLSPSTEIYDRGKKLDYYQTLESLQEYLLIAQDMVRIEHYVRQTTGGWFYSQVKALESVIELPSINCTLSLTDVYDKVTFPSDGNPIET